MNHSAKAILTSLFFCIGMNVVFAANGIELDRIGIFNYNTLKNAGFVDVDWMNYQY